MEGIAENIGWFKNEEKAIKELQKEEKRRKSWADGPGKRLADSWGLCCNVLGNVHLLKIEVLRTAMTWFGNRSCKKLRVQKMLFWKRIWLDTPPGTDHVRMLFWKRIWLDTPPGTDHVKRCVFKK